MRLFQFLHKSNCTMTARVENLQRVCCQICYFHHYICETRQEKRIILATVQSTSWMLIHFFHLYEFEFIWSVVLMWKGSGQALTHPQTYDKSDQKVDNIVRLYNRYPSDFTRQCWTNHSPIHMRPLLYSVDPYVNLYIGSFVGIRNTDGIFRKHAWMSFENMLFK